MEEAHHLTFTSKQISDEIFIDGPTKLRFTYTGEACHLLVFFKLPDGTGQWLHDGAPIENLQFFCCQLDDIPHDKTLSESRYAPPASKLYRSIVG